MCAFEIPVAKLAQMRGSGEQQIIPAIELKSASSGTATLASRNQGDPLNSRFLDFVLPTPPARRMQMEAEKAQNGFKLTILQPVRVGKLDDKTRPAGASTKDVQLGAGVYTVTGPLLDEHGQPEPGKTCRTSFQITSDSKIVLLGSDGKAVRTLDFDRNQGDRDLGLVLLSAHYASTRAKDEPSPGGLYARMLAGCLSRIEHQGNRIYEYELKGQKGPENFTRNVSRSGFAIVDFWTEQCPACERFRSAFQAGSASIPEARFVKMKMDTDPDENEKKLPGYQFSGFPTIAIMKDGKVLATHSGAMPQHEFEVWVRQTMEKERQSTEPKPGGQR